MKRLFTFFNLVKVAACFLFLSSYNLSKAQNFVPLQFSPGYSYNADVILDGPTPGIPTTNWMYTTGQIDSFLSFLAGTGKYALVSSTYNALSLPLTGSTSLAPYISANTAYNNVPYITNPATSDNVLLLRNSSFDTLIFTNQTLIGDLYILGTGGGENSGGGIGPSSTATVTILFANGTTQVVSGVVFPNYMDTLGPNIAKQGIGRANILANNTGPTSSPSKSPLLFDIRVQLAYNNYGQQIKGIRVAKTGGEQINIFGVTIDHNPCIPTFLISPATAPPTPPINITQAHNIKWNTVVGGQGFEWRLEAFPNLTAVPTPQAALPVFPGPTAITNPTPAPGINDTLVSLGVSPLTPLIPNTVYVLFVRSKCAGTVRSAWNRYGFKTPDCATVSSVTAVTPPAGTGITTNSIHLKWCRSCIFTAASITHNEFNFELNMSSTPPTGMGNQSSALPADTAQFYPGLLTDQQYYFHVRNKCTPTAYGPWKTQGFKTLPCPTAGVPTIVAGTLTSNSVTVQWPGSADAAVIGYQYALMIGTTAPTTSDYVAITDTFKAFNNVLNPGQTYRFYVKSDCSNVLTPNANPLVINVPFYSCDSPTAITVTNINIHGAQIDWTRGFTPSPEPLIRYHVGVTQSILPPTLLATTFPAHNPPTNRYFETTDTFFHPTTLSANQKYYVHVRTLCDTVNVPTPIKFNYSRWKTDSFMTPATCIEPIVPTIDNITASSAHMEWNLYYGILGYEYYIDEFSTDPTFPTGPLITYNQVDPINLYSGTNYWFHLRTQCDAVNYSPWTNTPFTTLGLCGFSTPSPALQSSPNNPGGFTAIFTWPTVPDANKYDVAVTQTTADPVAPDASVSITTYTATGLTPSTNYYFHLKASCSPNDNTAWQHIPFTTSNGTGVGDINNGVSVLVYPNPVADELTVDIQNNKNGTLQVIDVTGKVIYSAETKTQKTNIDMSRFSSGVYMIKYFVDAQNMQMIRVQKL